MADRIDLDRATDDTGELVTDATAYFFEAGTSTPLVVYTDNGLGTSRGTSVAADAEGVFPACWVASGTAAKVDVRDGGGVSLPGFPDDNAGRFPEGGQAASDVVFSPVPGNTAIDGQTAIANNTAGINVLKEFSRLPVATGSGGAYAITATTTISGYEEGQAFTFIANHDSVGTTDTLNVDGQGAISLEKYDGATSKSAIAAGDLRTGDVAVVVYDGTSFVVLLGRERSAAYRDAEDTLTNGSNLPDGAAVTAHVAALFGSVNIVTGSRAAATNYTNSTGGPMFVLVEFNAPGGGGGTGQIRLGGTLVASLSEPTAFTDVASIMVPSGVVYRVELSGSATISRWTEIH